MLVFAKQRVGLGRLGTPRDVTGASLLVHGGGEKPVFLDAVR